MKRYKLDKKTSKKMFTRNAMGAHPKNTPTNPMRGGIRL